MYGEDNDGSRGCTYRVKTEPVLTANALDVLRRILLIQNAAYYIAHIAVADDSHGGKMARDITLAADLYSGEKSGPPTHPHQAEVEVSRNVASRSSRWDVQCAGHHMGGDRPLYAPTAAIPDRRVSLGAAPVEAFFWEIWRVVSPAAYAAGLLRFLHECPSGHGSGEISIDFRMLRPRAL